MRLSQMPLHELITMEARVQAALTRKRDEQRKAVLSEIHAMLKGSGFTVRELFGNGTARRRKSLNAKLRAGADRFLDAMGEEVRSNGRRRKKHT